MKYLYLARKRGHARSSVVNPLARARARALLGAVQRRERLFGTQDGRRVLPGAHRRRHRVPQRRAEACSIERGGVDRRASSTRTRPASTSCVAALDAPVARRPRRAAGRDARRHGRASPTMYARGEARRARLDDGHHPARQRRRQRAGDREPRRWRAATSGGRARPDADPRPLRRAGRRRDGRLRHRAARRRADRRERSARALARAVGLRRARRRPGSPRPRWSRRRGAGELDVLWSSGGNFLDVLPDPARVAARARRACRCASTRTSCVTQPDARRPGRRRCCCCPPRTRYEQTAAAPRPPPSAAIAFSPEIPGRASARRAASGRSSPTLAARVAPERAPTLRLRRRPGDPRRDRRASCPFYAGIETLRDDRRRRSSGAASASATAGDFPTADGKAHFAVVDAARARAARPGRFLLSTRRGKQFNSMVWKRARPAHRRRPRRAVHRAEPTPRALGVRRRRRGAACARDARRAAGPRARSRRSGPATCRCSSPRRTRCCAPAARDAASRRARLQRGRRGAPGAPG